MESILLKSAFRQKRQNTAVARLSFGCLLTIALALGLILRDL